MSQDAWRAYLEVALGITEASGKKAIRVARQLADRGGVPTEQVQNLVDDLIRVGSDNREALLRMIRSEAERALSRMGVATGEEVTRLAARVRELEDQLRAMSAQPGAAVAQQGDVGAAEGTAAGSPEGGSGSGVADQAADRVKHPVKKVAKKAVKKAVRKTDLTAAQEGEK